MTARVSSPTSALPPPPAPSEVLDPLRDRDATLRMMRELVPEYPGDAAYVESMPVRGFDYDAVRWHLRQLRVAMSAYDWSTVNHCLALLLANDLDGVRNVLVSDEVFRQATALSATWLLPCMLTAGSAQSLRLLGMLAVKLASECEPSR